MNTIRFLLLTGLVSILVACGSNPEERKATAEAELTEEKTKTMQEYKTCVKKAKNNQQKLDVVSACLR